MPCPDIQAYMLTDHARFQMARRHVTEADIATVLTVPEQREEIKPGRCVYQSRFHLGDPPKTYLVRVFVDVDRIPAEVVTVYRTSKVSKYWR